MNGTILVNRVSPELEATLQERGFTVVQTELTEFLKAGGAAKCLTLRLDETVAPQSEPVATVLSRTVTLEGHLVDSDLLTRAVDCIVDNGGSFQILKFQLGEKRQSTSRVELAVSAPTEEALDTILSALIERGRLSDETLQDARLERVEKAGVAPDDFYVTTIYPTQVRVAGQWIPVQRQRMDGVIVVKGSTAYCTLIRDLQVGDAVVCGVEGIRTVRQASKERSSQEFTFMGSGVSSERRVELLVEQIAWELRQIKERGGKTVVVAGPVVIHTGGGSHLATLIREGYVQALLGAMPLPFTTWSKISTAPRWGWICRGAPRSRAAISITSKPLTSSASTAAFGPPWKRA